MAGQQLAVVIGATGNVGGAVVRQLAEAGVPVRGVARKPPTGGSPPGVDYVQGDLERPETLEPALRGAGSVFLVWPFLTADHAPAALDVIGKHVWRLVYLSSNGVKDGVERQSDPINQFHADLERFIARAGFEWTFLRAGGLAVNTLMWAAGIRAEGVVGDPFPHSARSLVHEDDLAAVAVRAMTEGGHGRAVYDLTGPRALTIAAQVAEIGSAIGRELRVETIPLAQARRTLLDYGLSPDVADGILDAHAGMDAAPEPVTRAVEEITGRPARTFEQWALDHADDFR